MRSVFAVVVMFAVGSALPARAGAADAIVDPDAGTPAGVQYQIPLDTGRQDAAPHPEPRRPVNGSILQTENGFGSSSQVPGADAAEGDADSRTPQSRGPGDEDTGAGASADGPSGQRQEPSPRTPDDQAVAAAATVDRSGSGDGSLLLLVAAIVAAAAAGTAGRRSR